MVEILFAKKSDLDSHTGSGGAAHADATTSVDGFLTAADKTKLDGIATGAVTLPVADTVSLVEDPVDATKEMRIDVEAVATGTVRVLTMPDQNVDLTPSSGTFEAADAGLLAIAGLTTAADRMIYTSASDVYAVATLTAAGRALIDDDDAEAQRTTLGLVIGTDVQTEDAGLTSIAGLTTLADRMIYTTADDVYAVATLSVAGRALIDDADATAQRTTLGLAIGTDVQADLAVPSQAEAEAGTVTTERVWTAERVSQAIAALAPGAGTVAPFTLTDTGNTVLATRASGGTQICGSQAIFVPATGQIRVTVLEMTFNETSSTGNTDVAIGINIDATKVWAVASDRNAASVDRPVIETLSGVSGRKITNGRDGQSGDTVSAIFDIVANSFSTGAQTLTFFMGDEANGSTGAADVKGAVGTARVLIEVINTT